MTSKILRRDIAARLKKAREKAGYASAEAFCQKNGLALDLYLAHEQAEAPIRTASALLYCRLLGLSLPALLVGE